MPRRLAEQSILFISVLKWVVLATIMGVIVGLSTSGFLLALKASTLYAAKFRYFFVSLPVAFFLSAWIIKKFAPEAEGHGTEKVIEAVHKQSGRIKGAVVPVKLIATIVTLMAGGSAGKEGPCAQIGAGLCSLFADLFRFDDQDRRKLVICGISAGFASVFGTPIGGAIFGVEVLFVGSLMYDVLLPSFIAGVTSFQISSALGVSYFYHPITFIPVFSEAFFLKVVLAGVFFGLCSFLMVEILRSTERLSSWLKISKPLKGILGGTALMALAFIYSSRYLGLGLETIEGTLNGQNVPWDAFLVKSLFTGVTLSFGGSGGIVTPIFFVGATAGNLFARLMGLHPATFSAIGLVSLLAGAANTPIAASIMAVELFGTQVAPYAAVACVISFLMTGHRGVYPSQILSVKKSPSLMVQLGQELEGVTTKVWPRKRFLLWILRKLKRSK
ncbi:MAG: chloride channel protein [Acidobacteriia bacterium]|nr:chloride channel protein [Terriglobia bacterium]